MALEAPSWLNIDLIQNILRKSKKNDSIRVIDIFIKPATAKGDNYTSDMYRVIVEMSRRRGDRVVTENRSFIVKIAPREASSRRDLIEKTEIFSTEITVMMDTLKKMNNLLGPEHLLSGRIFHVQREYPEFLMIEDLATLGYRMAHRQAGLDLDHCLVALRGLARFHASSVAVCEKEPNTKQLYNKAVYCSQHPSEIKAFFTQGVKALVIQARKWPELDPKYVDKIEKLGEVIYDKTADAVVLREDRFNVINHGDMWINNMMFRYNDEGKPIAVIFVDFQMVVYTTPALDLNYFLSTSPSEEVFENKRDLLLKEYLSTLSSTMKQLGCKTSPPTMKELQRDLEETAIVGMTCAFVSLPLILLDQSKARDFDELIQEKNVQDHPAYSNMCYRKLITKRIPIYDRLGLLDL